MIARRWVYTGAGVAAMLAVLAWSLAPRAVEVESASITLGRFETAIEEDGKTRVIDQYTVSAPLSGMLERITLREGDQVAQGDRLASIRPATAPLLDPRSRREQQARLGAAQAQAAAAKAALARADIAREQAEHDAARTAQLARSGFVASSRLEADALAALSAGKARTAALAQQQAAMQEVALAGAALAVGGQSATAGDARFTLHAPVAGRVLRVIEASEVAVVQGTPLLELGDPQRMEVVAELLSADAVLALPGSPVQIDRWGGAALQGRVRQVEPSAFTKISALGVEEQRVRVRIDLLDPPDSGSGLGIGYRVNVRIRTACRDPVLKVPVSALFPAPASGAPAMSVYTIDHGRARLRQVKIGARNDREAWIEGGLSAGTPVIIYPGAAVRDGVRVRVRDVSRPP